MPPWLISILRNAAVVVGLGLLFAWLAPYNTGSIPYVPRVLYWGGTMLVGVVVSSFVIPLIFERLMPNQPAALQILATSTLISIPILGSLYVLHRLLLGNMPPLGEAPIMFLYVLVISLIVTTGSYVTGSTPSMKRVRPAESASDQSADAPRAPALLDRLPTALKSAEIYAVSAEDHYLRVHTSAGEELILLRLSDAIRELAGLDGLQTHRSWWVARNGLADAQRENGKLVLKLKSGTEAPVSRTYQKSIKDAGWA